MFCKQCGSELKNNAKFCDNCGAPAASAQSSQHAYTPPEQPVYAQPVAAPEGFAGNGELRQGIPMPGYSDRVNHPEILAAVKKNRKAGISVMDATLKDGILTVYIGDENDAIFYAVLVKEGADTSSMPLITAEEYAAQVGDTEAEDVTGVYTAFGAQIDQYGDYILNADDLIHSSITLNEDGTGHYEDDEDAYDIDSWSIDGDVLTMTIAGETMTAGIENGVITLYFDNFGMTGYYAKPDTDISGYDLISQEEYRKIASSTN